MTLTDFFTLAFSFAAGIFSLYNYLDNRRKDFEDQLFKIKLELYNTINDHSYEVISAFDVSADPFETLFNINDPEQKERWYIKQIAPLMDYCFRLESTVHKSSIYIPSNVLEELFILISLAKQLIAKSGTLSSKDVIDLADRLIRQWTIVQVKIRADLKIEKLDQGLNSRIMSSIRNMNPIKTRKPHNSSITE
jgi:hypothetical protein